MSYYNDRPDVQRRTTQSYVQKKNWYIDHRHFLKRPEEKVDFSEMVSSLVLDS